MIRMLIHELGLEDVFWLNPTAGEEVSNMFHWRIQPGTWQKVTSAKKVHRKEIWTCQTATQAIKSSQNSYTFWGMVLRRPKRHKSIVQMAPSSDHQDGPNGRGIENRERRTSCFFNKAHGGFDLEAQHRAFIFHKWSPTSLRKTKVGWAFTRSLPVGLSNLKHPTCCSGRL